MRHLIAVLALLPTLALADVAGPARVIDGDTIEVAGHRMAAKGIQFPWRWDGGTISTVLNAIWGMSDEKKAGGASKGSVIGEVRRDASC